MKSQSVVLITGAFTGMVLALQSFTGFARFNAEGAVANVVVISITRELGPVIGSLMVAGLHSQEKTRGALLGCLVGLLVSGARRRAPPSSHPLPRA